MSRLPDFTTGSGAVEFAFLERYYADWTRGGPAPLVEYQRAFPGREVAIAAEYERLQALRDTAGDAADPGRGTDPGAAEAEGQLIGGYELRRELGRGGQAVVYEAFDPRLKRRVALKVLRIGPSLSRRALLRFTREAEVASRVEQRGLCAIYGAGEDRGRAWIAMRCIDGETLAQRVEARRQRAAGPHPAPATGETAKGETADKDVDGDLACVEAVLYTLHDVHRVGLVHRDLKPGNIMVEDAGPVILDFGLARDRESEDGGPTLSQEQLGTPAYMSPEQVAGEVADPRSDVYACGLVLYELLTGEHPFAAPTRELMFRRVLDGGPADPRRHRPHLSRDLATVLLTALARDPHHRYQSALAFAEDLCRLREGRPILARRPGGLRRLWLWSRRNRALAASLALSAAVLLGALGVTTALLLELRGEQVTTRQSLQRTRSMALAAAAREQVGEAPMTGLLLALRACAVGTGPESLSALYRCWDRARLVREFRSPPGTLTCGEVLPGERHCVCGYADGRLRVLPVRGDGAAREIEVAADPVMAVAVGGAEAPVFCGTEQGRVAAVEVADGRPRLLAAFAAGATVMTLSVDPTTGALACGDLSGGVWTWSRRQWEAGAPGTRVSTAPAGVIRVLHSPSGRRLLVLSVNGTAQVLEADGRIVYSWPTDGRWGACFLDENRVVTSCIGPGPGGEPSPGLHVQDLRLGTYRRISGLYRLRDLVAGMSGQTLWLAGDDGRASRLDLLHQTRVQLPDHAHHVLSLRLDPRLDPKHDVPVLTASFDQTLRLFDPRTRRTEVFRGHEGACRAARFVGDGLFSIGEDGVAAFWSRRGAGDLALPGDIAWVGPAYRIPASDDLWLLLQDRVVRFRPAGAPGTRGIPGGIVPAAEIPCVAEPRYLQPSRDGRRLLLRLKEGRTELWDTADPGVPRRLATAPHYGVRCWSVLMQGGRVFTVVTRRRYLWDESGAVVASLPDSEATVISVAADRDCGKVACGDMDGRIQVCTAAGEPGPWHALHQGPVLTLGFHPDGGLLVSGGDRGRVLVSTVGGAVRFDLPGHRARLVITSFSPDGRYLLTLAADGAGRIWRVGDGGLVATLPSQGSAPSTARFAPDSESVLIAGIDGRVVLHRVDGSAAVDLPPLGRPATQLQFSRDGRSCLVSGMGDRVCVWPMRPDDLLAAARARVVRDFTPAERERFAALLEDPPRGGDR